MATRVDTNINKQFNQTLTTFT